MAEAKPSFYKKALPNSCIAFHDNHGKSIFKEALQGPFMECYFTLSSQFLTQSEPAFCGLSTLCMVLNSLEVDPLRQWKGVWRWYDEAMLDCCRPLELVKEDGITLPEFSCLAKCNGLQVEMNLAQSRTKEKFLSDLETVCSSKDTIMVVSFSRETLGQTGNGHFSPIGGYSKKQNLVLVMDVARFKYPTYWVSADLLWESLLPLDKTSKKSRGWCVLKRNSSITHAYSQLNVDSETWIDIHELIFHQLPKKILQLSENATIIDFCCTFLETIPEEYDSVVENRTLMYTNHDSSVATILMDDALRSYIAGLSELLKKVAKLDLYKYLSFSKARSRRRNCNCTKMDYTEKKPTLKEIPCEESPRSRRRNCNCTKMDYTEKKSTLKESPCEESPRSLRKSQIQRLRSLSALPAKSSLTELLPVQEDLDYSTAFLTLFACALFKFKPELFYLDLKNTTLARKIEDMVEQFFFSNDISDEIKLINCQISALTEYIRK